MDSESSLLLLARGDDSVLMNGIPTEDELGTGVAKKRCVVS